MNNFRKTLLFIIATILWMLVMNSTELVAQTTVVLPKSCKGCPLSTNGTGDIASYDNCNAASSGTLTQGMSATGVTQTIAVTVAKLGTYNLSAIANGVIFSASGSFTATGSQNIVLTATGVPTATGPFNYTINTTPNCSFSRTTAANSGIASGGGTGSGTNCFANAYSLGIQELTPNEGGLNFNPWDGGKLDDMLLASDRKTFYDMRGYINDSLQVPSIAPPSTLKLITAVPVHVMRQKFPNETWKKFTFHVDKTASNSNPAERLWLLSDSNDLYCMLLNPGGGASTPDYYFPMSLGPTIGGKLVPPTSTSQAAWNSYVYKVIKFTSPTLKFSTFFHVYPHNSPNANVVTHVVIGHNPLDNLLYSWGGNTNTTANNAQSIATDDQLFRATPASLSASMTPSPATYLNDMFSRNGTTFRENSDTCDTYIQVGRGETIATTSAIFIGNDGAVYRYWFNNNKNHKIVLPGGVKAKSLVDTNLDQDYVILGEDGKLYRDNIINIVSYPTSLSLFLPTTNDQLVTAIPYNTKPFESSLSIKQIFGGGTPGEERDPLLVLTNAGEVYKIYPYPTPVSCGCSMPTITNENQTTLRLLPLYSRILAARFDYAYVGISKASGNLVGCNGASNYSRLSDTNQITYLPNGSGVYLYYGCYDPWAK